ncbi:MAG: helix-turn-helix domain-containing protein [Flavobacteriaceae bacterium]|nr:helix-turn-helix domain-containing protein [Flavobacteriaceae bacterium]
MIHKTIQIQEITVEELVDKVADKLVLKIEEYLKELSSKKEDVLLSRRETADYLKVDLSTIHNWTKNSKIKAYYLGNRVYYKKEEIIKVLEMYTS